MLGLFLQEDAREQICKMSVDACVKTHALEVIDKGYTLIKGAISTTACDRVIAAFREFEKVNADIFSENIDEYNHYPRIVNLHAAFPWLVDLFTTNHT